MTGVEQGNLAYRRWRGSRKSPMFGITEMKKNITILAISLLFLGCTTNQPPKLGLGKYEIDFYDCHRLESFKPQMDLLVAPCPFARVAYTIPSNITVSVEIDPRFNCVYVSMTPTNSEETGVIITYDGTNTCIQVRPKDGRFTDWKIDENGIIKPNEPAEGTR